MPWAEISISVARSDAAEAEQALEELGALAITLEDDADHPVLEPDPGTTPLWPTVHVRALFEADIHRNLVMDGLTGIPGAERPQNLRWRDIKDQDWERAWLDGFKPMPFGEHLWIVPSGMSIPHDPENIEIRLDPGLAFGTGTHPTTALCLEWLDGFDLTDKVVVDYGVGSGILAIAAALKGAEKVCCVDNDVQALEATRDNARRNGVEGKLQRFLPDDVPKMKADLVLANILAGPLMELHRTLTNLAKPGASIVLSGILEEQAENVIEAYSSNTLLRHSVERDGWMRIHLCRS